MVQQEFGLSAIVNLLMVGNSGVSKTSLISSQVNDGFETDVPARLEDAASRDRLCSNNLPTRIIDSSEPLAPLFDPNLRSLTSKCRQALIEIFKRCDKDNDGLLNDQELNQLQEDCFGVPLMQDALEDLKSIIKQSTADGLVDNSMTQKGFLFVHTLYIDNGQTSFTWKLLRKFNYDNQLEPLVDFESLRLNDKDVRNDSCHVNETLLLSIDDSNNHSYLTSDLSSASKIEEEEGEEGEEEKPKEHFSGQVELWLQDNKRIIRQSVGFTMATLISMFALKFIVRNVIKTRL